jgi:colicin import membrane protein
MNELIALEKLTPMQVFNDGGIDPIIERIEQEARSTLLDISTKKGREEVKSLAYKIAQSKTALDKMGKDLVAGWKEQANRVDQERSRIWGRLEALQKEIRSPLTEWENKEKDRIAGHEMELVTLGQCATYAELNTLPSAQITGLIDKANEIHARDWQEFAARAGTVKEDVLARLQKKLAESSQREAQQAEIERLRREEEERKRREHEERIARAAAEQARKAAEEKARKEAEAEAARVRAEQERAEQERLRIQREKEEAEARAKKSEEDRIAAIAEAEEARIAAAAKAEADRKAAEEKARQDSIAAAEAAKRAAEAAAKRERDRIEAEQRAEAEATAKREADKKHRAKINNEVLAALVAAGLSEDHAKVVITAVAKGDVPHVAIRY